MTGAEIAIGLALLFLGKKSGGSSSGGKGAKSSASTPGKVETDAQRIDDGLKLVARANQPGATKWATIFEQQDVPKELAAALARWAGIESSGIPTAVSKLGERGLLQVGEGMKKDGAVTDKQWDEMISPVTTSEEHAKIAYDLANWLWKRAAKHLTNPPTDYVSAAWYAKLYHQWPVDVRDGQLHGPAMLMAKELASRWADDAVRMHRLRAANVVAFGQPSLP